MSRSHFLWDYESKKKCAFLPGQPWEWNRHLNHIVSPGQPWAALGSPGQPWRAVDSLELYKHIYFSHIVSCGQPWAALGSPGQLCIP